MNLDSQPSDSSSVHQVRLTNGATLLIKRDTSVPVVSLNFWVEAGSIDEAPEERGMAHLIEHMIFKGTQKRGVGEISRDVEAAGGYLNAFTSFEHTCFYVVLPSDRIFEALDIEFDAFLNSTFDAGELAKEKEVVFEEMKMRRDDPWSWSWEILFRSLFKQNPYHWSVIGDEAVLRSVPRESLRDYYRKHYVPERTVICVVGNVDIWAAEKWVREHFESVTAPVPPPRRVLQDEEPSALQYLDEPGDVQQYYVSMGFPTVPTDHPDAAALEVLDAVLSDGGASRLNLAIREGSRSADEIGAEHFSGKYGGAFVFQAVTDRRRVERLLEEVMEQVARLDQEEVSAQELKKIKTRVKASKIYEKQSVDGQAKSLGYWQLQGDYGLEEKFLAALDAVTASDLRRVSRQYLRPRRATLLFYRPRGEKAFDAQLDWQARLEKALARPVAAADTPRKRQDGLQRFKLPYGATLLVRERHAVPLVSVGIYLKGGFRDENSSQAGLTSLMTKSLVKGTQQKSYAEYSRSVEGLAAHVDSVLEKDYWGLVGESLRENFQETFSLMTETLFTPAFSKTEIEKERQMQLAALRRLKDDPSDYALLKSDTLTFTGTPYAHSPNGTLESV
ncbi:MAG: M16 family metallopeptidase, partial [bacterium]